MMPLSVVSTASAEGKGRQMSILTSDVHDLLMGQPAIYRCQRTTDSKEVSVKVTPKIAMFTLTALVLAGGGATTAFASSQTAPKAPAAVNWSQPTTATPGSDGELQDDQTTSNGQSQDKADATDTPEANDTPDATDTPEANDTPDATDTPEANDTPDGPGGHADPAGDVNHEATGQE
jgi:hypothetical protein